MSTQSGGRTPRPPLIAALEDEAILWLDESSQKLGQLAELFETIRDIAASPLSPATLNRRIAALAELGRAVADEVADCASSAHDRMNEALDAWKAGGER